MILAQLRGLRSVSSLSEEIVCVLVRASYPLASRIPSNEQNMALNARDQLERAASVVPKGEHKQTPLRLYGHSRSISDLLPQEEDEILAKSPFLAPEAGQLRVYVDSKFEGNLPSKETIVKPWCIGS